MQNSDTSGRLPATPKIFLNDSSNSMVVSCAIYAVYIAKFFWWEHGYFNSIDIMHDRFGFYIFWGIMNWVPGRIFFENSGNLNFIFKDCTPSSHCTWSDTHTSTATSMLFLFLYLELL